MIVLMQVEKGCVLICFPTKHITLFISRNFVCLSKPHSYVLEFYIPMFELIRVRWQIRGNLDSLSTTLLSSINVRIFLVGPEYLLIILVVFNVLNVTLHEPKHKIKTRLSTNDDLIL